MLANISQQTDEVIKIIGAKENNLKDIHVSIPRNKLVVLTGLSGSGKSSLAFDTLYAEGQRRYVESLSAYARQFLGKMNKPNVEQITGISPAIAIEQKSNNRNPRSTVGTSTEIYEYLKLLYARIGKTFSPISGKEVKRDTVTQVADFLMQLSPKTLAYIYTPLQIKPGIIQQQLGTLIKMGFSRIGQKSTDNQDIQWIRISEYRDPTGTQQAPALFLLIDRITIFPDDAETHSRVFNAIHSAYYEGNGVCHIAYQSPGSSEWITTEFSNRFELDDMVFEKPNENFFSFNNPYGACPNCEGFGSIIGISEPLVIPNPTLSVFEDAVVCWKGEKMKEWKEQFIKTSVKAKFPIHKPYYQLTEEQKHLLWYGNKNSQGIYAFFDYIESQNHKIQYRVMLARFRGKTFCPACKGTRLRKDAGYVKIGGKSIQDLLLMPIDQVLPFFQHLSLNEFEQKIAYRLLDEIIKRLTFLIHVGLPYLTLNRLSSSLSGGEAQRINIATQLGSALVGSMYILDEPSIGLHPRDTNRLIQVLKQLRDLGNTVIVVEHDEEIIRAADHIIDIGPMAGKLGGEVIFEGSFPALQSADTLTADYITGRKSIEIPARRRKWKNFIELRGAREFNLQNVNVKFPLGVLTVVTGVSGSGKTTLVRNTLYPALKKHLDSYADFTGSYESISGELKSIEDVELVDQNPIGRSSRSNPATYVKAYDDIRSLFASQPLAKKRNYKAGFFSFNVTGGRCEHCEGEGKIKVEMQFMADIYLTCENCQGKRFKEEVLEIKYQNKNIHEVLNLTIDEAIDFFAQESSNADAKRVYTKLLPLQEVGLGYLQLGQSSSSLSGGEAQRVKLAYFLTKGNSERSTFFIFDEPTTGLHFHDIHKLKHALDALIALGHTVLVVEHHPDLIACADWLIDMGPDGGKNGGQVIFEGTPENLIKMENSFTAQAIKNKLIKKN